MFIGLSLGITQSSRSGNSIESQIAALSGIGGVYNFTNPTAMSQDSAGDTPVTAAGQPVGRVLDRSGNGYHATQTTTTSRLIYGLDANGKPCLTGDGIDDFLQTGALTLADYPYIACAMAVGGGGPFPGPWRFLRTGGSATAATDNLLEEYTNPPSFQRKVVVRRFPSVATLRDGNLDRPALGVPHVSWTNNGASTGIITANGVETVQSLVGTSIPVGGGGNLSLFRGNAGNFMLGRLYGFVWLNRQATPAEHALISQFLVGLIA